MITVVIFYCKQWHYKLLPDDVDASVRLTFGVKES